MKNEVLERISREVQDNDVVLYMKGSAAFPQCGFSAAIVQILESLGIPFVTVDVLGNATLRQALKEFADWPSTPQLYIKGEFVGGCDIVREMHSAGELHAFLAEKGILR